MLKLNFNQINIDIIYIIASAKSRNPDQSRTFSSLRDIDVFFWKCERMQSPIL